jgi:hypothetical protein
VPAQALLRALRGRGEPSPGNCPDDAERRGPKAARDDDPSFMDAASCRAASVNDRFSRSSDG